MITEYVKRIGSSLDEIKAFAAQHGFKVFVAKRTESLTSSKFTFIDALMVPADWDRSKPLRFVIDCEFDYTWGHVLIIMDHPKPAIPAITG